MPLAQETQRTSTPNAQHDSWSAVRVQLEDEVAEFLERCIVDDSKFQRGAGSTEHSTGQRDAGLMQTFEHFLGILPMCADLDRQSLYDLVRDCRILTFEAGQVVCREGDCDHQLFVILDGSLLLLPSAHTVPPGAKMMVERCAGREPAYAASSQHESSEEEKGEDQSELLNDYVDDLYFVLGLLPQDRLAPFINQMRRVARALCSRAFRVWIHHVQRQSKTVEFCGTCLKTSLENSFFQWHQWAISSAKRSASGRVQALLKELEEERNRAKQKQLEWEEERAREKKETDLKKERHGLTVERREDVLRKVVDEQLSGACREHERERQQWEEERAQTQRMRRDEAQHLARMVEGLKIVLKEVNHVIAAMTELRVEGFKFEGFWVTGGPDNPIFHRLSPCEQVGAGHLGLVKKQDTEEKRLNDKIRSTNPFDNSFFSPELGPKSDMDATPLRMPELPIAEVSSDFGMQVFPVVHNLMSCGETGLDAVDEDDEEDATKWQGFEGESRGWQGGEGEERPEPGHASGSAERWLAAEQQGASASIASFPEHGSKKVDRIESSWRKVNDEGIKSGDTEINDTVLCLNLEYDDKTTCSISTSQRSSTTSSPSLSELRAGDEESRSRDYAGNADASTSRELSDVEECADTREDEGNVQERRHIHETRLEEAEDGGGRSFTSEGHETVEAPAHLVEGSMLDDADRGMKGYAGAGVYTTQEKFQKEETASENIHPLKSRGPKCEDQTSSRNTIGTLSYSHRPLGNKKASKAGWNNEELACDKVDAQNGDGESPRGFPLSPLLRTSEHDSSPSFASVGTGSNPISPVHQALARGQKKLGYVGKIEAFPTYRPVEEQVEMSTREDVSSGADTGSVDERNGFLKTEREGMANLSVIVGDQWQVSRGEQEASVVEGDGSDASKLCHEEHKKLSLFHLYYEKRKQLGGAAGSESLEHEFQLPLVPASPYSVPATPLMGSTTHIGEESPSTHRGGRDGYVSPFGSRGGRVSPFDSRNATSPCLSSQRPPKPSSPKSQRDEDDLPYAPILGFVPLRHGPGAERGRKIGTRVKGGQEVGAEAEYRRRAMGLDLAGGRTSTPRMGQGTSGGAAVGRRDGGRGRGASMPEKPGPSTGRPQILPEAPSTKSSRLKLIASAPARERAKQEKRMHQVAEQIALRLLQADAGDRGGHDSLPIGGKKTMLAKGIGIKGIAASLLSHEARKCRIAD